MASDDLQRFLDELRSRISIADVVGAKVKLVKKGREYQGLCPFHHEKTPSFTVNEAKGFYHCFGCGAHGDIIRFEMEAGGLPFMDAIQKLAHMAGLSVPTFSNKDQAAEQERKSLYEIMEQACIFFEKELRMPDGAEGWNYFTRKRDFSPELIKEFRLGYAPNNNALMAHLRSLNVKDKDLIDLGLMTIPEDKTRHPHDFFRNRVMIPITNKQGKIIAFGGRVMEKIEPKYLNSPETPIFNKRRNLYNLDKAREVAYKEKKLIICEGYMDVIALHKYGFGYAVAPLGTALTEEQILEAWKICPEPILCLDGDTPGKKAALRVVDRILPLLKAGYSLKFLFLPENMDPDEYLKAYGKQSFATEMEKTKPLIDILWQKYTENTDSSTPEKKALIEKTLLEEVNKITDNTVRDYYAREIKNRIYLTYKKTAWQIQNPQTDPTSTNLKTTKNYTSEISTPKHPYFQSKYSYNNNWNKTRGLINHNTIKSTISAPIIENKTDKNIRFIIAAELIYPELIDDYEEQIILDDIPNKKLYNLQMTLTDLYHNCQSPISGEELYNNLSKTPVKETLSSLWEIEMIKKQSPFINDLRKNIKQLLEENKSLLIQEEIKQLSQELSNNFDEEKYTRLTELKKAYDDILTAAEKEIH